MTINLEEAQPIAFAIIENKKYYINNLGNVIQTQDDIKDVTLCMNFDSEDLLKEFAQKYCLVEDYIKNDISDVIYIKDKFDPYLIKLNLNNGNTIKLSFSKINSYLTSNSYNILLNEMKDYICIKNSLRSFLVSNYIFQRCS